MSLDGYRYDGQKRLVLRGLDTDAGKAKDRKDELIEKTRRNMKRCAELQEQLMADGREGLLIAIQSRDAAGTDSLIRRVFSCFDPAGLRVTSFKQPTRTELSHDYLWRLMQALPERGHIGVFSRTHYEDVLTSRVRKLEKTYRMPERVTQDPAFYRKRYRQLRDWEQYLYENGYRMVKLFLNISREEQSARLIDCMELPEKYYKISHHDLNERALWTEYDRAYEDAINATGTPECPWYVIPADSRWYTRYLVSEVLLAVLTEMDPQFPPLHATALAQIPAAIDRLTADNDRNINR